MTCLRQISSCYHLISHPIEKCFMLKDKIMRLHENGDIVFDDEIIASNITTIVHLGPHQSPLTISFGSFESIELGVVLLTSFTVSLSQASRIPLVPRVSDSKPNSSRNCDNKGWSLVTHRRGRNKCKRMIKPTIIRT